MKAIDPFFNVRPLVAQIECISNDLLNKKKKNIMIYNSAVSLGIHIMTLCWLICRHDEKCDVISKIQGSSQFAQFTD